MKTLFILSPGHGEDIKGKRSPEIPPGIIEWKFVREISDRILYKARNRDDFYVVDVLNKNPKGYNRSMTLKNRVKVANDYAKVAKDSGVRSVYVALHTNAAGNRGWYDANGTICFVAPNASDFSRKCASIIGPAISEAIWTNLRPTKTARFYELTKTTVPAILVEMFFHTSVQDCKIAQERKTELVDAFVSAFESITRIA